MPRSTPALSHVQLALIVSVVAAAAVASAAVGGHSALATSTRAASGAADTPTQAPASPIAAATTPPATATSAATAASAATTPPAAAPPPPAGTPLTPAGTPPVDLASDSALLAVAAGPGATATRLLPAGPFAGALLIADRGNGRLLIVDPAGRIRWRFPAPGALPAGQRFSADDAFLAPDGRTIVANDEQHQDIVRIDIATGRIVWRYGRYGVAGSGPGELHNPDDAYPLANGDVMVADILNCRILEIAPDHAIVHQWGRTRVCVNNPPTTFDRPNGDTPLPDGGILVTDIGGSRVIRLAPDGHVVFNVHAPVRYPSDAQLAPDGSIVLADYSSRGQVVAISPTGRLLWRWAPATGQGRLDHPSLAIPLANGDVVVNDDFRARVIVIDPRTHQIVWQFGRTDAPGAGAQSLRIPDGMDPIPASVVP